MRLLFVQSGASVIFDNEGNAYVNSNDDAVMWRRYGQYCTELRLMFRNDGKVYTKQEAMAKYFPFKPEATVVTVPDVYRTRDILRRFWFGRKSEEVIAEEVRNADRIIVRTPSYTFSRAVLRMCRKYNKVYMIEVIDDAFGLQWHSERVYRKFIAPYADYVAKKEIARAPYAVYVSRHALQERYPTKGRSLGCSDVELPDLDESLLEKRMLGGGGGHDSAFILGTAAGIGRLKGQEYVIRAVAELRKQGITNIEYRLAGTISPRFQHRIDRLITSLHVEDSIKFCGPIPHDRIFDWYDQLDVYIQPSFTEALGRSVIEAMSRALPAACASVGGMVEYASANLFFQPGNVEQICIVLKKLLDPKVRRLESERSFTKAGEFAKSRLDPIRNKFYMDFMHS